MLKLRRLEIENVGKFTRPVCIEGLKDGLNVLATPNEAGKSTLMRALLAAIFMRHRTTGSALDELRDANARTHPEVRVDFELGGGTYRLEKRFAGPSGRAWLESRAGARFQNEEAESELQRLLGFDRPGRKAELGVWGALWVRQGESLCEPQLDEVGRDAISACLGTQVNIATGGSKGRQIRRAICERRERLLTRTGRPTAQYGKLIERERTLVAEFATLDERRRELASQLTQLGETERAIRRLQRESEEKTLLRQLEEARTSLQRARQHASELEAAQQAVGGAQARLNEITGERQRRKDLEQQLVELRTAKTELQSKESDAQARVADVDHALGEIRRQQAERKAERRAVDTERDRLSRLREHAREASDLATKEAVLEQLRTLQERARAVRRELEEYRLTRELLQRMRDADSGLEKAKARAAGAATHVSFDLVPDALARVCVDDQPLPTPDADLQVLEHARIAIDGIGAIDVRPQVRGAQQLEREVEQAEAELRRLLDSAGVASLDAAARDAARREELCLELRHIVSETERLAPGDADSALEPGADALAAHLGAKREALRKAIAELGLEGAPDLALLTTELERKSEEVQALDRRTDEIDAYAARMSDERRLAGEHAATCAAELRATLDQLKQTKERLAAACSHRSDETLKEQAERWMKEHAVALERERELAAQDVPELRLAEQTVRRLEQALEEHRRHVAALANQCAALRATIEAREGEGLEETIATKRGELERTEAEVRGLKDEADALVLLDDILSEAERDARDRYLEPVIKKLRPHLSHIWPGAAVQLDEQFKIRTLVRDQAEETFALLSDGTREQLAVLTRLALAELLLDQSKPAMLMLDDALVFSDDDRIERMFDILNRAAERLQILVFTCRTRSFRRLGGHALTLREVSDHASHLLKVA